MPMIALLLAAATSLPPDAVARVGARTIMAAQLSARIAALRRSGTAADPRPALDGLIDEALLAQQGSLSGLETNPEVQSAREAERRRLAAQVLTTREIEANLVITDEQLRAAYHASSDGARLDSVTLPSRELAQAALDRIRGGGSFLLEAQQSLDLGSAMGGGDLGLRSRAELDPALREAAFSAPLQALQGPVHLIVGWGVFRVRERTLGDEAGFQERKSELRNHLLQSSRKQAIAHVAQRLRARSRVVLDEKFLESTGSSLKPTPEQAEAVVARVGDRPVRYSELVARLQRIFGQGGGGHLSGLAVKTSFAWELIDDLLLEREAMDRGFGDDPAALAGARAAADESMARIAAERIRRAAPEPGDVELRAYYQAHADEATRPGRRACAHLLVATREEAQELLAQLGRGADWDQLVRKKSLDVETAEKGGSVGDVDDGFVTAIEKNEPELAAAIKSAPPGRTVGPVATHRGQHLLKCAARTAPQLAPFAEVRAAIAARLQAQAKDQALRTRLRELRAQTAVQIDEAALQRISALSPEHAAL